MLGCGGAGWVLLLGCAALGVHPVAAEHAAGSSGIMVSGRRAEAVPPGTLPLRAVLRGGSGGLWGNTLQGGSTSLGTSGTFNSGSWSAGDKKAYNPGNDPEVEHCPSDGVTQLAFSPKVLVPKQYLVSSSWDGQLRCWEVEASSGKTSPVGMQRHEKPLMCCTWTADGSGILAGGADGKGMYWRIETGAWTQFASHDAAIVGVFHAEYPSPSGAGCYITGSWDRTVKFWDPRSSSGQPIGVLQVPERVYAMDVVGRVMVIATAERHVLVYDLRNPAQPFRQKHSPLKYQTRCVAVFPNQAGFCVGSVEGRVGIEHIEDADLPKNFAFKCHRHNTDDKEPELHSVNSIAFHPVGTFATAGGDGAFNLWDKDAKHRLKAFPRGDRPITAAAFNHDGALYAYAAGHDWSKGAASYVQLPADQRGARIMVHLVGQEAQPKSDAASKRW